MTTLFQRTGSNDFPQWLKMMVSGPPKSGKHLANGTPVLTPDGWRAIETLAEGDMVIGSDGYPTRVTGVFPQGVKPMRRLIMDDGGTVLAGDTHLWTVLPHGNTVRTQTTDEIAKHLEDDKRYAYLPVTGAVQVVDRLVGEHIPPYALGLLLGDGALGNGSIQFTKPEPELHQALIELLPGCEVSEPYGAGQKSVRINGLRPRIVDLGLAVRSEDKFIPEQYLWTSVGNRLALLAGLLDTDGGMNGKSTCFYTSSPQLRDDVVALVRSLGGTAVVRTKAEPTYTYKGETLVGQPAHNISIRLPADLGCPFRLTRKMQAWSNGTSKRPPTRRIISIEPIEDMEATCIKVANEDGLFVTQDYIVTHNTSLLGTVPNIVIADTEPFANNLASIAHLNVPYTTITSSNDLMRLLFVLRDESLRTKAAEQMGIPRIEAVGLDTVDTLQAILKKERVAETRHEFQRDDWGWMKEQMTEIVQAFMSLPMHVILTVHTKSKELGKGEDARTIIVPGLEGAIAESIAGMVGYSVLSYRKQDVRPDGSPYTKYWLRTEGDETYDFLGTRTAGRLPDVIEPDFATILKAAMAGRPVSQAPAVDFNAEGAPVAITATPAPDPVTQAVAQPQEQVGQNPVQSQSQPAESQQPATGQSPNQVQTPPPGNDEPVNAAALTHVKKVYDALALGFPEATIRGLTLGDARNIVMLWQAAQHDAVQGQGAGSPQQVMTEYLVSMEWLLPDDLTRLKTQQEVSQDQGRPAVLEGNGHPEPSPAPATLADCKTIEDIKQYVGDDLVRIQEAYDAEVAKVSPRSSLLDSLVRKGATVRTPAQITPPATEAPVTQQPVPVDPSPTPSEEQMEEDRAVATLQEGLGAEPVELVINADSTCQEGNDHKIDDIDIAKLSQQRFDRLLCVQHYINQTKKPAA